MRSSNHRAIQAIQGHRASRPSPRFSVLRWAGCHTSARAVRSQLVVCGCRVVGPERCAHRPAPSELHYRILRKSKRAFDGGMGLQCCSSKSKFLYGVEPDSFWALKLRTDLVDCGSLECLYHAKSRQPPSYAVRSVSLEVPFS